MSRWLAGLALLVALIPACAGTAAADKAAEARAEVLAGQQQGAAAQAAHQAAVEAEALAYARQHLADRAGGKVTPAPDSNAAIAARVAAADAAADAAANAAGAATLREAQRAAENQRQVQAQADADAAKARAAAAAAAEQQRADQLAAAAAAAAAASAASSVAAKAAAGAAASSGAAAQQATASVNSVGGAPPAEDFSKLAVEIVTGKGTMILVLRPDKAPGHVQNFVDLIRKGFYDGLTFHRIIPGFLIQGGDPKADGSGGPGYQVKAEFNDLPHQRGTLSMSRGGHPDSAGSQFFICSADAPQLDGKYTAFGRLVTGLETLDAISAEGSPGGTPREPVIIRRMLVRPATPAELQAQP